MGKYYVARDRRTNKHEQTDRQTDVQWQLVNSCHPRSLLSEEFFSQKLLTYRAALITLYRLPKIQNLVEAIETVLNALDAGNDLEEEDMEDIGKTRLEWDFTIKFVHRRQIEIHNQRIK